MHRVNIQLAALDKKPLVKAMKNNNNNNTKKIKNKLNIQGKGNLLSAAKLAHKASGLQETYYAPPLSIALVAL